MSDEKRPGAEIETEPKPTPNLSKTPSPATDEPLSTLMGSPKLVSAKQYAPHKRWRVLVAVLAAAALLGGGLLAATQTDWLKTPDVSEAEESAEPALDPLVDKSELGADGVASVEICFGDETYTLQKNADGLMTVADFADLPRNADRVNALLSELLTITPESQVLADATDAELAACGLTDAAASAVVTYTDGDTFAFDVGNLEPGENAHYYFRRSGERAVYLAEATLYQALTHPAADYLATVLTPAPAPASDDESGAAKLDSLTLTGTLRAKPVVLRHAEEADPSSVKLAGNYVLTEPYFRAVNTALVYPWETGLCDATASGVAAVHPTAEQLDAFGLNDPHSVASLTFAIYPSATSDGTSDVSESAYTEPYNRVSYTLSLGGKNETGDYYALLDGVDIVYTVAADTVPWAEETYDTLVSSALFLHYITDVSDLSLTVNGVESVIHLTHTGGDVSDAEESLTATAGDRTFSETDTRALYRLLMMVGRVSDTEPIESPSGTPTLVLKLSFLDGSANTACAFYPHSANRYLCVAEDGDTFQVKAADVENLLTQIARYLNGESVDG